MLNLYSVMKDDSGLTLIETLLAMAMLIILVTAFTGAFVVGLQGEVDVDQHQAAGALAENIVEQLREENLAELEDNSPYEINDLFDDNDFDLSVDELSSSAKEFYENQNISDSDSEVTIENIGPDTLYSVEVNIEWTDRGENRNFTLETRIHSEEDEEE